MKVSDAVVEVAARELARRRGYDPDESWQEFDRSAHLSADAVGEYFDDPVIVRWQTFSDEARAAIEAALPLVLGEPVAEIREGSFGLHYIACPEFESLPPGTKFYAPKEQQP